MYRLLNNFKPGDRVIAETSGPTYTVVEEAYTLGTLLLLREDLGIVYRPPEDLKVKLANDRT